jgi:uncharacterized protein (DUF169 family)
MQRLGQVSKELEDILRLRTRIVGYKSLEEAGELDQIEGVLRIKHLFAFGQVPFMARVAGHTIGITREDPMLARCMRIHGLKAATERSKAGEAKDLATTWLASPEDGLRQQEDYPRIPPGGAIVLGPVSDEKFEPDVVLVYGNPAQVMMLMCGLQKEKYERFNFHFIGEGACADSLAQCYNSGKPALAIPCFGERAFGQVADDEIVIALPPTDLRRAVSGLKKLATLGMRYPIRSIGGEADITPLLMEWYPDAFKKKQ